MRSKNKKRNGVGDGWGRRPRVLKGWDEEAVAPWDRPECTVIYPDGQTVKAIDYEEAIRIAVSAAYKARGEEVRLLEPGFATRVVSAGDDGGLVVRGERSEETREETR